MTQSTDFAFNDTITRIQSTGPDGIKATNIPLTKREYFAAMAMQGLSVSGWEKFLSQQSEANGSNSSKAIAVYAVDLADELIKVLNETP